MKHKHYLAAVVSAALLLTGCQQTQTTESEEDTASTENSATETQVSLSEEAQTEGTTFHPVTEVSSTTQTPAETSETTQVTAKPKTKTFSPDGSLSCESINQPENMSVFIKADRTADGFGCITYDYTNEKKYYQIYYHSFSENLQTVKTSSLAIPELDGYSLASPTNYYLPAFDGTEIWAFVTLWSDTEIQTPEVTGGDTHTIRETQYLLCHYDESGSLLSTIPVNEFKDYSPHSIRNFVCSGGKLYMTMSDSNILQIDKETAKISVAADLGREQYPEGYNRKFLCFDRDDKPVVLQEKWYVAPDTSKIEETKIIDYDLESGSSGQTLYSTDEVLKEVTVVKGCGEYRFFINTHHELIGIKDDGSKEVLIDIDASELENQIMTPEDHPVPYTDNLFDINIIPVDDTQFLALYWHYPDGVTEAYCLTLNQ